MTTSAKKGKKMDFNSSVNQEIKGRFVAREVKALFSYEMEAILKASITDRPKDELALPTYEEIENLYEYKCPECGEAEQSADVFRRETDFFCHECGMPFDDEPESEPQEIFEWWIVTEYLYEKLKTKGEPVLEWGTNWYWGRTTTGQAIMMDSVIGQICADMEILDGQKYSWAGTVEGR